jgi:transposase-like protein
MAGKPRYPPEVMAEAVRLVRAGASVRQAADELGVKATTLGYWVKQAGLTLRHRPDPRIGRPRPERRITVAWVGSDEGESYRLPSAVRLPAELAEAQAQWRARVEQAGVEDVLHRHYGQGAACA